MESFDDSNANTPTLGTKKQGKCHWLSSKVFILFLIVIVLGTIFLIIGFVANFEKDRDLNLTVDVERVNLAKEQQKWFDEGLDELKAALNVRYNTKRADNVIIFIADGMGPTSVTAARINKYKEEGLLSWEKFPHMGLLKTYCEDKQVPDSASTATSLFGGVKANYETSGVDSAVKLASCTDSLNKDHHVDSIIKWAQDVKKSTGFVTTTRVMHATPAALYAHAPDRRWECETAMPENLRDSCKDIARQLIEDDPGKSLNVIMGGGRQCLVSNITGTTEDPLDTWSCISKDGRNLINDWKRDKTARKLKHTFVENNGDLSNLNVGETDYLLGIFANGHLPFDHLRNRDVNGQPSLKMMTEAAIKILSKNHNGFVLVVEGGMIDQAHHRGWAKTAISEISAFDEAVEGTLELLKDKLEETLIIVTSDHSHTLSINGYAEKGSDIFGIAQKSKFDQIPYTTLSYATGHFGYQVEPTSDSQNPFVRRDPSQDDTTAYDYVQQVAIKTDENTHGGQDVTIHARGPFAHLIHKVHEQSYVAHIVSFAARLGRFRESRADGTLVDILGIH